MAFTSTHRFARMSAQKARLVVDQIRGLEVGEAKNVLTFSKRRAAVFVHKTLLAAEAAAEEAEVDTRSLVVTEARVDEGPTIKRFQPKDRGRAHPIKKRTCHIVVAVDAPGAPAPTEAAPVAAEEPTTETEATETETQTDEAKD